MPTRNKNDARTIGVPPPKLPADDPLLIETDKLNDLRLEIVDTLSEQIANPRPGTSGAACELTTKIDGRLFFVAAIYRWCDRNYRMGLVHPITREKVYFEIFKPHAEESSIGFLVWNEALGNLS